MAGNKLIGDNVEQVLHKMGADKIAELIKKRTKRDCGCKKRKEYLNKLHERMIKMREKVIEQQSENQKRN